MTSKDTKEPDDVPVKDAKGPDAKAPPVGGPGMVTREGATLTDEDWRKKQARANAGVTKGKA